MSGGDLYELVLDVQRKAEFRGFADFRLPYEVMNGARPRQHRLGAVGGPVDLASPPSQTDAVTVLAAPLAMRDFPAKRNLLFQGRDLDQFPKFPGTVGNHASSVSANVIGISHFFDAGGVTVDLGEVHNNRDGETLFHSSVETDERHPDTPGWSRSSGAPGVRAAGPQCASSSSWALASK